MKEETDAAAKLWSEQEQERERKTDLLSDGLQPNGSKEDWRPVR